MGSSASSAMTSASMERHTAGSAPAGAWARTTAAISWLRAASASIAPAASASVRACSGSAEATSPGAAARSTSAALWGAWAASTA